MVKQRVTSLLHLFVILIAIGHNLAQDSSITFLPDVSRCIGEEVEMICYVVPPAGSSFAVDSALISLSGSIPTTLGTFNGLTWLGGVDTTRYTADVTGLTISTSRPGVRVTISDYQATDGSVLFGCAGFFPNGSASDVLISDSPQSLAAPPSSPVSLTADYNSPTCSGTVQLAWTPGASDRDIEMYFLSLNGVLIASLGLVTSYNHPIIIQRHMEYTYSVVAMSCAGSSTETSAPSISVGNSPSSPVVTLSQTDFSCSNLLISWSTPSSDRPILVYSVYRNDTLLTYTADNLYTDNTQLSISTVYEYSVRAFSCVGASTAGVNYTSIGGTSLATNPPPSISYDSTTYSLFVDWTLNLPSQPIIVTYNLTLVYSYSQNDITYPYNETYLFSQTSTVTNYSLPLTKPIFSSDDSVLVSITAILDITKQCNTTFSDIGIESTTNSTFTPSVFPTAKVIGGVIAGVCGVLFICISAGVVIICVILFMKKSKIYRITPQKCNSSSVESEEQRYNQAQKPIKNSKSASQEKMEGLHAGIDHTLPKPETLKRTEAVEETLYSTVQTE